MPESVEERVARLEESMASAFRAIEALTEKEAKLDEVIVLLTEAQIETQKKFQETDERFRRTDERIDKLVSAIGEFLRRGPSPQV